MRQQASRCKVEGDAAKVEASLWHALSASWHIYARRCTRRGTKSSMTGLYNTKIKYASYARAACPSTWGTAPAACQQQTINFLELAWLPNGTFWPHFAFSSVYMSISSCRRLSSIPRASSFSRAESAFTRPTSRIFSM